MAYVSLQNAKPRALHVAIEALLHMELNQNTHPNTCNDPRSRMVSSCMLLKMELMPTAQRFSL